MTDYAQLKSPPLSGHSRNDSQATLYQNGPRNSTSKQTYSWASGTESYALLGMPSSRDSVASARSYTSGGVTYSDRPTGLRRLANPFYLFPILILSIHTFLLILSWSFFSVTISRPVALQPTLARLADRNIQSVTLVVTLLASLISVISGILYTRAIRWSLARFLTTGVSMYTITAALKMAKPGPIKNFVRPGWTIGAAIIAIAVNAQTAGWTTLIIPKRIEISSEMRGFELDMASEGFRQLMETNRDVVTPDMFNGAIPITEDSGTTAVSTRFNIASILNVNRFSYTNSTLGIMPVAIEEISSNIRTERTVQSRRIPVNVEIRKEVDTPSEFPKRFTMTQQAFTARIKCERRALDRTTSPSIFLGSGQQALFGAQVTLARLQVGCVGAQSPAWSEPVLTSNTLDGLFAVSCPRGGNSWDLIIAGAGVYSAIQSTVCNITPEINTVTAEYSSSLNSVLFNSTFPSFVNGSVGWNAQPAPWLGDFALSVFLRGLQVSQTRTGNSMGDSILSFLATAPNKAADLEVILQEYVRGVLELSITLLRVVYTQEDNRLYPNQESIIPRNMRIATNGTYHATTVGWNQAKQTAAAVLLAPTFVSLLSITIILATLLKKRGSPPESETTHFFDAGDILHLMSASSTGGMKAVFPPFHENIVENNQHLHVALAPVDGPGSRPGFVSSETR